jgi:glycosyltransferase involved in cell wall biosynthesis
VGGNQWYKNRLGVLRLFAELIKHTAYQEHQLVLAGKPWTNEMRAMVARLGIQDRVIERVEVSNEQLRALYSRAAALLFPSLSEGFGWPIAEAQACGCPVITTNRPPMTDVGGEAAIYIDPRAPADGAKHIANALTERVGWIKAGLINARRFSTEAMVVGYERCYAELAIGQAPGPIPRHPGKRAANCDDRS